MHKCRTSLDSMTLALRSSLYKISAGPFAHLSPVGTPAANLHICHACGKLLANATGLVLLYDTFGYLNFFETMLLSDSLAHLSTAHVPTRQTPNPWATCLPPLFERCLCIILLATHVIRAALFLLVHLALSSSHNSIKVI